MPNFLTLDELKAQLRVEHVHEDALLTSYLDAAEGYLGDPENGILGRPITNQEFVETFDSFGDVSLAHPDEVTSISLSYVDGDGATQTLDPIYTLKDGRVRLNAGESWPTRFGEVTATYSAGWDVVPEQIKMAGYILAATYFEVRSADQMVPKQLRQTIAFMVAPYRRIGL